MKKLFGIGIAVILVCLLVPTLKSAYETFAKDEECVLCGNACSEQYQSAAGYVCEDCYKEMKSYFQ